MERRRLKVQVWDTFGSGSFENIDPNDIAISNLIRRAMLLVTQAAIVEVGVNAGLPDYAQPDSLYPSGSHFVHLIFHSLDASGWGFR